MQYFCRIFCNFVLKIKSA